MEGFQFSFWVGLLDFTLWSQMALGSFYLAVVATDKLGAVVLVLALWGLENMVITSA